MTTLRRRTRPPALALPRRIHRFDLDADPITLLTVQPRAVIDALESDGIVRPDVAMAEPHFRDAYDWMSRQMAQRLPTTGPGMFWLWARTSRREVIDLCSRSGGEFLLQCRVPRERVLLSHFGNWHLVLNPAVMTEPPIGGDTDESLAEWDRAFEAFSERLTLLGLDKSAITTWPAGLRDEVEQSWTWIFETSRYPPDAQWQATVHHLEAQDIVSATRLVSLR